MSEQVRKQITESKKTGHTDLSELSASKDLHRKIETHAANSTDLASVSISSLSFVRSSSQIGLQSERTHPSIITKRAPTSETKHQASASTGTSARTNGVFKNPLYPYTGGLVSKIITFLANLLKVLERVFLRLLGVRDTVAPPPRHQPAQAPKAEEKVSTESKRQKAERDAQAIHRS
jgi:hypothetical protein